MKKICVECFTLEELIEAITALLKESPHKIEASGNTVKSKLLTRAEAADMLDITLTTLNTWTKQEKIRSYRQGSRIYYKEDELMASLKEVNHRNYKKITVKN